MVPEQTNETIRVAPKLIFGDIRDAEFDATDYPPNELIGSIEKRKQ